MQVQSRCPLTTSSILWMPRAGAYAFTVVCKVTFQLAPEISEVAGEQEPVYESDSFWDENEEKSLESASDLVPHKRHAEVLLVGHAYAPRGAAVGGLVARLTVAEVDKAIDITGDRHIKLDGTVSHPSRFTKMPLRWERAAGGADTSNPVGVPMGDEARADGWGRIALPNFVPAGRNIASRDDVVAPVCFAPMAPHWPSRVARLHRHAASFRPHAWHARPLPADIDLAYFNAAPQDQLVRELVGGEHLTLENLHPHHALLTTRLAKVTPRAMVDWGGGSTNEVALVCDTLLVDTDRGIATKTYRGHVSLDYPERPGWIIVTSDLPQAPAPAPKASVPEWIEAVKDVNETVVHAGEEAPPAALPFEAHAAPPYEAPPAVSYEAQAALPYEAPHVASYEAQAALPYEAPAALPFSQERRSLLEVEDTGELEASDFDEEETFASVRGDAPFSLSQSGAAAPMVPPVVPKGPRLGAFRLQASSELPAAMPPAEEPRRVPSPFDDAPTMDPESAQMIEIEDDPSTFRNAGRSAEVPPARAPMPSVADTPFVQAAPAPAPRFGFPGHGTAPSFDAQPPNPGLPFTQAAAAPAALPFAPGVPAVPGAQPFVASMAQPPVASRGSTPGMTIGEIVAQARLPDAPPPPIASPAPQAFAPESTRDGRTGEGPAAPPVLGPLATPEMVASDMQARGEASPELDDTHAPETAEPVAAPAPAPAAAPAEGEPLPLPLDEYPIERCARITAQVARTKDKTAAILESHKLDEERWEPLKAHWLAEIKKETERGKTALLRVYDAAYVAQLEDERGPIAVEEYARIVVGAERGTVNATLTELGLPEGSMLRIQRVWMGKMGKDPHLRKLVRSAVEQESEG